MASIIFIDSLKPYLSFYGHKLPVHCMDVSSDGDLIVSESADKNLKIWGMDFGDCHKSIFAHSDSANVNYQSLMKLTESSNIDGILVLCNCSDCACLKSFDRSMWKKANLIFLFFLLRKLILPFYSFTLFCVILPMTMFIPEAQLPTWVVCYIPATMSFLNILPSPRSFPFIVPYLLFENTMSVTKFNAMISGLFQLGSAYEWVVTKKFGRSSKGDLLALLEKETKHKRGTSMPNLNDMEKLESLQQEEKKPLKKKKHNRMYTKELILAFLLLIASARSLLSAQGESHFLHHLLESCPRAQVQLRVFLKQEHKVSQDGLSPQEEPVHGDIELPESNMLTDMPWETKSRSSVEHEKYLIEDKLQKLDIGEFKKRMKNIASVLHSPEKEDEECRK